MTLSEIPHSRQSSFQRKLQRLRRALSEQAQPGIILRLQRNVTWLTGMRTYVNFASDESIVSLIVTPVRVYAIAASNEVERLRDEEARGLDLHWCEFAWNDPSQREHLINTIHDGQPFTDDHAFAPTLFHLRTSLDEEEQRDLKDLARKTTTIIESLLLRVKPGIPEQKVAGLLSEGLLGSGIEPMVLLVGGDARAEQRPHPLPTPLPIQRMALVAVSVRRRGLFVSVTRYVSFERLTPQERHCFRNVSAIAASLLAASIPGASFAELWTHVIQEYERLGMTNGWQRHHQGGLTGYMPRELLLLPGATYTLAPGNAIAYNPSFGPWKSEDTAIVTADGPEIITLSNRWPTIPFEFMGKTVKRPDILVN